MASTHYQSRASPRRAAKASIPANQAKHYTSRPNQYYGHEDMTKMCAKFIAYLFSCPKAPATSSSAGPTAPVDHLSHTLLAPELEEPTPSRLWLVGPPPLHLRLYYHFQGDLQQHLLEQVLMEREMCGYLKWVLNVKSEDLHDFEAMVPNKCSSASPGLSNPETTGRA
ncbi:hypothetical protein RhiJN_13597 [Ceratobasidium sp. AG-Ba]|nr:hypothetical protein RhiJN_03774 [Ceratobasidium sp. AG-Ba]QRV85579.1 hypothetical protein RhiJN_13597 [Ceratobasidium sp. AG-Ba]